MTKAIIRLATGRALLAALVVAALEAAKHFGAPIPEGTADSVNLALDALIVLVAFLATGSAHHAAQPPEKPDDSDPPKPKHRMGPVAIVLCLLTFGCSGTFDDRKALGAHDRKLGAPQGSAERCADLSDAQDNWTFASKLGAGVGVSGALAPAHEAVRDDPTGRWVSLGVASGGALLAGVGVHMAGVKGGRYVQEGCGR